MRQRLGTGAGVARPGPCNDAGAQRPGKQGSTDQGLCSCHDRAGGGHGEMQRPASVAFPSHPTGTLARQALELAPGGWPVWIDDLTYKGQPGCLPMHSRWCSARAYCRGRGRRPAAQSRRCCAPLSQILPRKTQTSHPCAPHPSPKPPADRASASAAANNVQLTTRRRERWQRQREMTCGAARQRLSRRPGGAASKLVAPHQMVVCGHQDA